ncbi:MAG: hypothetical protein HQK92_16150 [Nitrospirae bacterium]|nr:hypothetical protein [Nitrospirota bacterium]
MSKLNVKRLTKRGVDCKTEVESDEMAHIKAEIFETAGKIKAAVYSESQGRFLKLIFLKTVKDTGNYKKLGITWSDFCSYVGQDRKRIDDQLADLKPFNAEFLVDFANFTGVDYSKIKYLGREISTSYAKISDDGAIICDGLVIPIIQKNKEEIAALLKRLEDKHKVKRTGLNDCKGQCRQQSTQ